MGEVGAEALWRAICDESKLNSIADSNHSCYIEAYKVNDEIRAKQEKPTEPEKYMYFFHREMKQCPTHSICDIDVTSSCQKFLKMC